MEILNVGQLDRCDPGERVSPQRLKELGLIKHVARPVKLLGDGSLSKRLTVLVHRASESAKAKVVKAGGSIELLEQAT